MVLSVVPKRRYPVVENLRLVLWFGYYGYLWFSNKAWASEGAYEGDVDEYGCFSLGKTREWEWDVSGIFEESHHVSPDISNEISWGDLDERIDFPNCNVVQVHHPKYILSFGIEGLT